MSETSSLPRIVTLQGGFNFRDLGGHLGEGGRLVRRGQVYRSGHLGALTDADVGHLRSLGVARVCDFRGAQEWTEARCSLPGAVVHGLHVEPTVITRLQALRAQGVSPTAAGVSALMVRTYQDFVHNNTAQFAALFARLLAADSATVFHCTAGKDRTGFAAALVLRALGVGMDAVMADFMLSNRFFSAAHLPAPLVTVQTLQTAPPKEALAVLHGVQPAFLHAAFHTIDATYGSLNAFWEAGLNLSPDHMQALRDKFLIGAD